MADLQITAEPGTQGITMTREFEAPRALLFRAFTEPELLMQWLGPYRLTMHVTCNELRDGGRWRFIHRDEAGHEFGFHGIFHGTPLVEGIVRTFEFEGFPGHVSLETVTFEDIGGRTVLRMNTVHQSVEARDGMIQSGMESGMRESIEKLEELLSTLMAPAAVS